MSYDYLFKLIIIGDQSVGKSTLLKRFTDDTFSEFHEPTIGVEFAIRTIQINNVNIRLQVWDTAGQEEFMSIARSYYRASAGVMQCYDITRRDSFKGVRKWLNEARINGNEKMSLALIGNKCDQDFQRTVSYNEGEDLADNNSMRFLETSSYTKYNIDKAFYELALEIYQKIQKGEIQVDNEGSEGVKPGRNQQKAGKNNSVQQTTTNPKDADCTKFNCCGD